eukprot:g13808.t1
MLTEKRYTHETDIKETDIVVDDNNQVDGTELSNVLKLYNDVNNNNRNGDEEWDEKPTETVVFKWYFKQFKSADRYDLLRGCYEESSIDDDNNEEDESVSNGGPSIDDDDDEEPNNVLLYLRKIQDASSKLFEIIIDMRDAADADADDKELKTFLDNEKKTNDDIVNLNNAFYIMEDENGTETSYIGYNPLILAIQLENEKAVECLLDHGAKVGNTDFITTKMEFTHKKETYANWEYSMKGNAVHHAVWFENLKILKLVLNKIPGENTCAQKDCANANCARCKAATINSLACFHLENQTVYLKESPLSWAENNEWVENAAIGKLLKEHNAKKLVLKQKFSNTDKTALEKKKQKLITNKKQKSSEKTSLSL